MEGVAAKERLTANGNFVLEGVAAKESLDV